MVELEAGEQDTHKHRTAMVMAGQWKVLRDAEREEVQATVKAFLRCPPWGFGSAGRQEWKGVLRRREAKWN